MASFLYEEKGKKGTKNICLVFFLVALFLFPLVWFQYFDISYPLNLGGVLFRSLYLFLSIISFFIVLRINICVLAIGWFLLILSFFTELLCELTRPPDLVTVYIKGELTSLSLLIVVIGVYITINRFQKAEKNLRESQERYKMIFEASPEAIVLLDRKGNFVDANKKFQEWLGYSAEEYRGKNMSEFDFMPFHSKKKALKNFYKRWEGRDPGPYELEFQDRNGNKMIGRLSVALMKDENKNLMEDLVMVSDVTGRKKAERQVKSLRELDKAKDEFLNIAAHELKTPLASIIGMSQILQSRKSLKTKGAKESVRVIKNEAFRLNRVVKQILTVTRFERGKPKIRRDDFVLGSFITSLRSTLELLAQRTNSKIKIEHKDKNVKVKSDQDKVAEVVYNLVENAVKYGREEQTITIRISRMNKNKAKVEVIDQGEGISKEMQKKIFVKFDQLENYLNRSQEGIGLGLYICKVILKKLGGEIKVKSTPGKGANFYFTLPLSSKNKKSNPRTKKSKKK